MLARTRDRCKGARRRTGCDRDRVDAGHCIADDRGAQGRWVDVREPPTLFRRVGGCGGEGALPRESSNKLYSDFNHIRVSQFYSDWRAKLPPFGIKVRTALCRSNEWRFGFSWPNSIPTS